MDLSELGIDDSTKERIIDTWKGMDHSDRGHFINQVALALSIWGSDSEGRKMVVRVLRHMAEKQTNTLADFGLYVETALRHDIRGEKGLQIKRAATIIEGYRIKNALSSIPHKELGT